METCNATHLNGISVEAASARATPATRDSSSASGRRRRLNGRIDVAISWIRVRAGCSALSRLRRMLHAVRFETKPGFNPYSINAPLSNNYDGRQLRTKLGINHTFFFLVEIFVSSNFPLCQSAVSDASQRTTLFTHIRLFIFPVNYCIANPLNSLRTPERTEKRRRTVRRVPDNLQRARRKKIKIFSVVTLVYKLRRFGNLAPPVDGGGVHFIFALVCFYCKAARIVFACFRMFTPCRRASSSLSTCGILHTILITSSRRRRARRLIAHHPPQQPCATVSYAQHLSTSRRIRLHVFFGVALIYPRSASERQTFITGSGAVGRTRCGN